MKLRRLRASLLSATLAFSFTLVRESYGCDLSALHQSGVRPASESLESHEWHLGIAQQFTSFGSVQSSGRAVTDSDGQYRQSSITQMLASYNITDSASLYLSLPYISRRFRRTDGEAIDRGTEAGIGDLTLLARYVPLQYRDSDVSYFGRVFAGIKLPTGNSDRIKEELSDDHQHAGHDHDSDHEDSQQGLKRHQGHDHGEDPDGGGSALGASVIHGHDLALGSGSVDFPIGVSLFAQTGRAFATATLQYVLRTEGESNYKYADDFLWQAGPAFYVVRDGDTSISLQATLTGEYKRLDTFSGERQRDTGMRSIFIGPALQAHTRHWEGELAWDIPLDIDNTGLQAVVDYRIRAALAYSF